MALIDDNYVLVEQENPTFGNDVTSQPVEKDIDMIDHVQRKARTMAISGIVAGPDASRIRAYLKKASDTGQIVKYVGRNAFTGLLTDFNTSHDNTIADGYTFSATLIEVRVAQSSYVDKLPTPVKAQAAKIVNSGVKQTKSKKAKGKGAAKKTGGKKGKTVTKVKFKAGSPWASGGGGDSRNIQ